MLTAKFSHVYTSKTTGNKRAWYFVSGSSTELEAYKAAQGSYLAFGDDGVTPLINADCPINEDATYKIKTLPNGGRYYVDFSMILAAAGAIETAEKRGNALLTGEIAKMQAQKLMGTTITSSASNALQAAVAEAPEPVALDKPISPKGK
jgi:hypothetical protein